MDWDGREIAARGRRATGRGLIGIGMAVSTEGKRNAHVISGTMRRSIHAAPHGHSGGNDEATAAGGTDIPDTQIPSWQGNDPVIDVGSWVSYACWPADAVLTSADGGTFRPEQTQLGLWVPTVEGRARPIIARGRRPWRGDLVELSRVGSSWPVRLTPDHPVLVRRGDWRDERRRVDGERIAGAVGSGGWKPSREIARVTAEEVREGDFLIEAPMRVPNEYRGVDPDFCRLLGYYLSEGFRYGAGIAFAFHADETEYHEDVNDLIKRYYGHGLIRRQHSMTSKCVVLRTNKSDAVELAEITGPNSRQKRLPPWATLLPMESAVQLLLGEWRGDGHTFDGRGYTFSSASRDLIEGLRLCLLRLGIVPGLYGRTFEGRKVRLPQGRIITRGPLYQLSFSGGNAHQWAELAGLPAPDCSMRSAARMIDGTAVYHVTETKRVPYDGEVFSATVEGDHSLCVDGINVGNCVEEVGRGHAFMQPAVESVSGPRSVALMTRAFAEEGLV